MRIGQTGGKLVKTNREDTYHMGVPKQITPPSVGVLDVTRFDRLK